MAAPRAQRDPAVRAPVRRRVLLLAAAAGLAAAIPARAQDVTLAGRMGRKALLVIDGRPVTLGVGEARDGVRLRNLGPAGAEVEVAGRTRLLREGDAPLRLGDAGSADSPTGGREIVLAMGPGGHFVAQGSINGRAVRFMVDTGASVVALSSDEAARIGLRLDDAPAVAVNTANGTVRAQRVTLSAVRLGEVTVANVAAVVVPAPMPHVLLGNSFLQRFQLRRDNDLMRLELR